MTIRVYNRKVLVLVVVMVLSIPATIFAVENMPAERNSSNSVTVSERDMILALQEKTDEELKASGYSTEDIDKLRRIDDNTVLKEAKAQSDLELKSRGLSDKQIDIIRNEKNVQKAASQVYGEVTYTIQSTEYKYSKPDTYLSVKATWNWSTAPLLLHSDIIACTTSESGFTRLSSSGSGIGVYADIDLAKTYSGGARPTKMVAYDGYIIARFKANSRKISSVGISSNYGHTIATVTPSVSFGNGTSISFSPSISVSSGPEAYRRLEL